MAKIPKLINPMDAPELRTYSKGTASSMEGFGTLFAGLGKAIGGAMSMQKKSQQDQEEQNLAKIALEGQAVAGQQAESVLNSVLNPTIPQAQPASQEPQQRVNLGNKETVASPLTRVDAEGNVVPLVEGDSDESVYDEDEEPTISVPVIEDGQAMLQSFKQGMMPRVELNNRVRARVKEIQSMYAGNPVMQLKAVNAYLKGVGFDPNDDIMRMAKETFKFQKEVIKGQQAQAAAQTKAYLKLAKDYGEWVPPQMLQQAQQYQNDPVKFKEVRDSIMLWGEGEKRKKNVIDGMKREVELRDAIDARDQKAVKEAELGIKREFTQGWAAIVSEDLNRVSSSTQGYFQKLAGFMSDGEIDDNERMAMDQIIGQMDQSMETQWMAYQNMPLNDDETGKTILQYVDVDELKKIKESQLAPYNTIKNAILNKEYGMVNTYSNVTKLITDRNTNVAIRSSRFFQELQTIKEISGNDPTIMMNWFTEKAGSGGLGEAIGSVDLAYTMSSMSKGEKTLMSALGSSADLRQSMGKDLSGIFGSHILPVTEALGNPKAPVDNKYWKNIASGTYGDMNLRLYENQGDRFTLFNRLTDERILRNIAKSGDDKLKDSVQAFAVRSFDDLFQSDYLQDLKEFAQGEHYAIKVKPNGSVVTVPKSAQAKMYEKWKIERPLNPKGVVGSGEYFGDARRDMQKFEALEKQLGNFQAYVRKMDQMSKTFGNDMPSSVVGEYLGRMGIYYEDEARMKEEEAPKEQ
jgi:hypothetical protein